MASLSKAGCSIITAWPAAGIISKVVFMELAWISREFSSHSSSSPAATRGRDADLIDFVEEVVSVAVEEVCGAGPGSLGSELFGVFFDEALGGLLGKKEGDVFTLGTLGGRWSRAPSAQKTAPNGHRRLPV